MIAKFVFLPAFCSLLTLTSLAVPIEEDPAEEQKPAKILFVTGCTHTRSSEIDKIDRRSAMASARDAAVKYTQGFDFEYMQEKDAATVRMSSGGMLKTGESLSFEQISFGSVNLLTCTIEVHLDKEAVERLAKEQEKTERIPFEIMLPPRQARFSLMSKVLTEALKKHYRPIASEGAILKGRGWVVGAFELEKVATPDKGDMLKVSFSLRLPLLEEK